MENYYITTPIYYANANPHLGHAYSTIVADCSVRFHKMLGQKTLFLTGSDEHGDKIVQAAEKRGLSPQEFVDEVSSHFLDLWPKLGIDEARFGRTTDHRHVLAVQECLQKVYDKGDIYYGEFGGWYCYGCERFYTEKELENGLCPQHLTKPEFISEKNYFFRMSSYLPWLKGYLEKRPDLIRPERYRREALAMLEGGVLEDLCISRPKSRLTWGIELPFDKNYVCYVWFDALLCYITNPGWPDGKEFKEFWPGEHLIAKDILKPHAIFWPCMLKALDLPVYRHLNVHGYWLSRDTKMSKSLGNVIDPLQMSNRFGLDAFRYFLLRDMRFGEDASFSEEALISRINADLANDLGNLFSRVLAMNAKYFDGKLPCAAAAQPGDLALIETFLTATANYLQLFERMNFSMGLESLWELIRAMNKYVDSEAPWTLAKQGQTERLGTVLNVLLSLLRKVAICLWPVMPYTAKKMLRQLGEPETLVRAIENGSAPVTDIEQELSKFDFLAGERELAKSSNLFPRTLAPEKKDVPGKNKAQPEQASAKCADISAFQALDIRAGTIKVAEKHPAADRILRLEIDFGEAEPRQILSGIAGYFTPYELVGQQVCAIVNLAPRKIRGLMSNGMVLTAEADGKLELIKPGAPVPNGARIA